MPVFPQLQEKRRDGSLIVVVGTDAPLLPHQMARLVRRVSVGLGRLGAVSYNSSGDIFIGFGMPGARANRDGNPDLDRDFQRRHRQAAASHRPCHRGVENALIAAETMVGAAVRPSTRCRTIGFEVLRKYGRLVR